jgi:ubiquitin-protein ligase
MMSEEMTSLGIYYDIDEADAKKGTGLIFGPEGTPYANCPLFFSVEIPADYPFSSPIVLIITSDGQTRFHPNLYVGGKVCLSILGTYSGPSWVSTLNIGSVFKSILSLLDANPITNEPGWEKYEITHVKAASYSAWVEFNLVKHTLKEASQFEHGANPLWNKFADILEKVWPAHLAALKRKVRLKALEPPEMHTNIPYAMGGIINWRVLV